MESFATKHCSSALGNTLGGYGDGRTFTCMAQMEDDCARKGLPVKVRNAEPYREFQNVEDNDRYYGMNEGYWRNMAVNPLNAAQAPPPPQVTTPNSQIIPNSNPTLLFQSFDKKFQHETGFKCSSY